MISPDDKILSVVINSFSVEDLESIIKKKKSETQSQKLTKEQKYKMRFEKWFKKKLYSPIK